MSDAFINPLPDNYESLSPELQWKARMRVIKDHSTPARFMVAWACFREWYLKPSETFYKAQLESPPFHYELISSVLKNRRNIVAAPRGSAKSTICSEELPLFLLLTRKARFDVSLCCATASMSEARIGRIKEQLDQNPLIREDFGVMKPKKGSGVWNNTTLQLANGNSITGTSVTSKKRGARPDIFIFDDPEYDPSNEYSEDQLSKEFEVLLFKVILPMLESGSTLMWIGTMISRRSFLYKACSGTDKRFSLWDRKILAAADLAPGSSLTDEAPQFVNYLWPEKWSQEQLLMRLMESGPAHFSSEYLNNPTSDGAKILNMQNAKCGYHILGEDIKDPGVTKGKKVVYHIRSEMGKFSELVEQDYKKWLDGLYKVLLVDYAYTQRSHSDFSACVCVGFDREDTVWVLDAWHGRVTSDALNQQIAAMGTKWQVHIVAPESIAIQREIAEQTRKYLVSQAGVNQWMPRVVPPDLPASMGKSNKISSLEWRFTRGVIKFPLNKEFVDDCPHFQALMRQVRDFTMDLSLLPFDDLIDALSMLSFVKRGIINNFEEEDQEKTIVDLVKSGITRDKFTGMSYFSLLTPEERTDDVVEEFLRNREPGSGSYRTRRGRLKHRR